MNDVGEYFIGNKVIKGTTGEEEIFDAPITTVTGEGHDVYKTDTDAIKVTGGANKDVLSEFNVSSVFTNKVTSTSADGIELCHYNYRVMVRLLERSQLESQHHQSVVLLEMWFSLQNHLSLVMLVGFIPHKTLGESLV